MVEQISLFCRCFQVLHPAVGRVRAAGARVLHLAGVCHAGELGYPSAAFECFL